MKRKFKISKNFLEGYARAISVVTEHRYPELGNDRYRDYLALRGDWSVVGKTIQKETRAYAESAAR